MTKKIQSRTYRKIYDRDRIAQAELVKYDQPQLAEVFNKPNQKSDRTGGFGSTGI